MKETMFLDKDQSATQAHMVLTGGGTGTSVLARGIAEGMPDIDLTVIVAQADDGGSTRILREVLSDPSTPDQPLNFPAVGDPRKVTAALSPNRTAAAISEKRFGPADTHATLRSAIGEMFEAVTSGERAINATWAAMQLDDAEALTHSLPSEEGQTRIDGHNLGNLVLAAMTKNSGSIVTATRNYGRLLQLNNNHRVIPVTDTPHTLYLKDGDEVIQGQSLIDHHYVKNPEEAELWIDPHATVHPDARIALEDADLLVASPGSLWGSQGAVMCVNGVRDAIQNMKPGSSTVAIANLVQQEGTIGMDVSAYAQKLARYTGREIDYVVYNNAPEALPADVTPVIYKPERHHVGHRVAIGAPLAAPEALVYDANDKIKQGRSSAVTDPHAVVTVLREEVLGQSTTDTEARRAA
ncbi:MAG TPA: 2-phospho-L-lactate transferase CofD family protein [Candidatus Limnocylindrales bacterium]|nr:2-phospho-L-lactate transferase CofD family protein [Candidatus Limnocylindrales bacterium]